MPLDPKTINPWSLFESSSVPAMLESCRTTVAWTLSSKILLQKIANPIHCTTDCSLDTMAAQDDKRTHVVSKQ